MKHITIALLVGCSHPAPPVTPNHAIEFVTILDHNARCDDWRTVGSTTHTAMCMSGDSLFWCAAPDNAKPHCDLLYAPPKKAEPTPPVSEQPKTDATSAATPKPKEP